MYEVEIPLTIHERLPSVGSPVELRTVQVVREDSVALYGFLEPHERDLFKRLLTASGVGAQKTLAMLSTFRPVGWPGFGREGHNRAVPDIWGGEEDG